MMKNIKMTLSALAVAVLACSCGKNDASAFDTPEKLMAEYKKCHENGGEGIVSLIYKNNEIPEDMKKMLEQSIAADVDAEIKEITIEAYDDSNEAMMLEALKERGLKMAAKPTNMLKIAYVDKGPVTDRSTQLPIAEIDGGYYLLAPIKAD